MLTLLVLASNQKGSVFLDCLVPLKSKHNSLLREPSGGNVVCLLSVLRVCLGDCENKKNIVAFSG